MSSKEKVVLVGVEWDAIDLIESLHFVNLIGIIESTYPNECYDLPYLGSDEIWEELKIKHPGLKIIVPIDAPRVRSRLLNSYGEESFITVASPDCYISPRASIGKGTLIQRGVKIMARTSIGDGCKLNINATVHHESFIGHFCTLAPGAQVLGRVIVENFAYIGAGAIIKQKCRIGAGAIIGAGAVVTHDIPPNTTVVGVPAKELQKKAALSG